MAPPPALPVPLPLPLPLPSSPFPRVAEWRRMRGDGAVDSTQPSDTHAHTRRRAHIGYLRAGEQDAATATLVREHAAADAEAPTVWVCSDATTPLSAPSVAPAFAQLPPASCGWAFPIAADPAAAHGASGSEAARMRAWQQQKRIEPARVALHITLQEGAAAATMDADRIRPLDSMARAWIVHAATHDATSMRDTAVSLLRSLLAHSALPVLCVVPLPPPSASSSSGPTAAALRRLDVLATLPSLSRLHVAFAPPDAAAAEAAAPPPSDAHLDVHRLEQHWAAMRQREEFRAEKQKQQTEDKQRTRAHAVADASNGASASVAPSCPPAAPAAPATPAALAQFYRAAFTPSTMFFRIQIAFSPPIQVSELVCHGVLTEGLRTLLGTLGASKCMLQLLQWNSATATGIVSTDGAMSVGARAAWMLTGSYQGQTCRIDVQQQSLALTALAMPA